MSKAIEEKKPAVPEAVTYALDEVCMTSPRNGDKEQEATILGLPEKGSRKYRCKLEDGSIHMINECYLEKK